MSVQTILLTPSIVSNPRPNVMRLSFPYPYTATGQEIALSSLLIYYSWFNITAAYGNNTTSYIFNGTTYNITFPDGYYAISDISAFIQLQMYNNGHYLVDANGINQFFLNWEANPVYYKTTFTATVVPSSLPTGWINPASMTLTGNTMQWITNNASFGLLLGFTNGTYPATVQTTTYMVNSNIIPQISPTTSVNVWCSFVNDARFSVYPQNIYTFSPNVSFTQQINLSPQSLLWFKIMDATYSYIDVQFMDQNGQNLAILDPQIVVALVVRDKAFFNSNDQKQRQ